MEYFQLWLYRKVPFFVLQLCFGFSRKFIHLVIGCCGRAGFVPAVSLPNLASHVACLLFVDHNPCSKLCMLTYIRWQGLSRVLWLHFQGFTDRNALKCTRYAFLIVLDWRSCTLSNYFRVNSAAVHRAYVSLSHSPFPPPSIQIPSRSLATLSTCILSLKRLPAWSPSRSLGSNRQILILPYILTFTTAFSSHLLCLASPCAI